MSETKKNLETEIAKAMETAEFPDLKAVLSQFMHISGGAKGIARMLAREYKNAKKGSMIRNMILQMILTGMKSVSAKEATRDSSLISDEDINRELSNIVKAGADSLER